MRTLNSEQKPNWPVYLPSLVNAYNATPHTSTGFQPYELMFGCKAPKPCDKWLGLKNYKPDSFKSKNVWLNQQLNAMLHANKQALKFNQNNPQSVIKTASAVRIYAYLLGIMCYCVITQKATTRFRTGTSQMCTLWLVIIWSQIFNIFNY